MNVFFSNGENLNKIIILLNVYLLLKAFIQNVFCFLKDAPISQLKSPGCDRARSRHLSRGILTTVGA